MIEKSESIREYEKKKKFINFKTSINSFYRFSSKESMSEKINNSKSRRSTLNFNDDLTKTFKKTFRDFFNDFDETSFFKNSFKRNIITRIAFRR